MAQPFDLFGGLVEDAEAAQATPARGAGPDGALVARYLMHLETGNILVETDSKQQIPIANTAFLSLTPGAPVLLYRGADGYRLTDPAWFLTDADLPPAAGQLPTYGTTCRFTAESIDRDGEAVLGSVFGVPARLRRTRVRGLVQSQAFPMTALIGRTLDVWIVDPSTRPVEISMRGRSPAHGHHLPPTLEEGVALLALTALAERLGRLPATYSADVGESAHIELYGLRLTLTAEALSWRPKDQRQLAFVPGQRLSVGLQLEREAVRLQPSLVAATDPEWAEVQRRWPVGARIVDACYERLTDQGPLLSVTDSDLLASGYIPAGERTCGNDPSSLPFGLARRGALVDVEVIGHDPARCALVLSARRLKRSRWQIRALEPGDIIPVRSVELFGIRLASWDWGYMVRIADDRKVFPQEYSAGWMRVEAFEAEREHIRLVDPTLERIGTVEGTPEEPWVRFADDTRARLVAPVIKPGEPIKAGLIHVDFEPIPPVGRVAEHIEIREGRSFQAYALRQVSSGLQVQIGTRRGILPTHHLRRLTPPPDGWSGVWLPVKVTRFNAHNGKLKVAPTAQLALRKGIVEGGPTSAWVRFEDGTRGRFLAPAPEAGREVEVAMVDIDKRATPPERLFAEPLEIREGETYHAYGLRQVSSGLLVRVGVQQGLLPTFQLRRMSEPPGGWSGAWLQVEVMEFQPSTDKLRVAPVGLSAATQARFRELAALGVGSLIEGEVTRIDRKGSWIDLSGFTALLFRSNADPEEHLIEVGDWLQMRIASIDEAAERISLSLSSADASVARSLVVAERRLALTTQVAKHRARWDELVALGSGGVVKGRVSNIMDYGAFVDLGSGVFGLVHKSKMSWDTKKHPTELVSIGELVTCQLIEVDPERRRVGLDMQAMTPDPWIEFAKRVVPSSIVEGRIKDVVDYGLFVRIADQFDGLVRTSEIAWHNRFKTPPKEYAIGDHIRAVVLSIDPDTHRLELSIKSLTPDPWIEFANRTPPGTIIEGPVANVVDFGVFVRVTDQLDGLIHLSDLVWHNRIKHPSEEYRRGEHIRAVVLSVDSNNHRLSLSVKALTPNPWIDFARNNSPGTIVEGLVYKVADFGLFVQVTEQIDGLVHLSEMAWHNRPIAPSDSYQIGDRVKALVLSIDTSAHRLALSIKALKPDPWIGVESRFSSSDVVRSRVGQTSATGMLVELESELDGHVAPTEMSWAPTECQIWKYIEPGIQLDFTVLNVSETKRRIELTTRAVGTDLAAVERLFEGQVIELSVDALLDDALVLALGDARFLVPRVHFANLLPDPEAGDLLRAHVLMADHDSGHVVLGERPSLGLKQSESVECKIIGHRQAGILVELAGGIQTLIDWNELIWNSSLPRRALAKLFPLGLELQAMVVGVQERLNLLELSVRSMIPDPWRLHPFPVSPGQIVIATIVAKSNGYALRLDSGLHGWADSLPRSVVAEGRDEVGSRIQLMVSILINHEDPSKRRLRFARPGAFGRNGGPINIRLRGFLKNEFNPECSSRDISSKAQIKKVVLAELWAIAFEGEALPWTTPLTREQIGALIVAAETGESAEAPAAETVNAPAEEATTKTAEAPIAEPAVPGSESVSAAEPIAPPEEAQPTPVPANGQLAAPDRSPPEPKATKAESADPFTWDVFIAHATADRARALELYRLLTPQLRVFIDVESISLGVVWRKAIEGALQTARVTAVLLSERSDEGHYLADEIIEALRLYRADHTRRRVVPIRLQEGVKLSYGLRPFQAVDASSREDMARAAARLEQLLATLRGGS